MDRSKEALMRNITRKIALSCFSLIIGATLLTTPTTQAGQSSARSVAMGGAFTSLAVGVDATRYNPANLGLLDYQKTALEVVGLGANIANNAFSLSDYNKYTGAVLTDADKNDILGKIPDEGLSLSVDAEAAALSFSMGQFAFHTSVVGQADVNLNKDLLDLILNGNSFGDTLTITGTYSDAVSYVQSGISYGLPLYTVGTRQLSGGMTFKYLKGIAVEQIVELQGMISTDITGFGGNGAMIARTASGGSGYSIDLGAALQLNDSYTVGARISNFASSISWSNNTEEHGYNFNFDTVTVDNISADYIVSDDYTVPIGSFSTSLPSVMNIGIANTDGKLVWAVDWEQGFRRAAGASKNPRIALGLEYSALSYLPLRTGFATGGAKQTAFSFGTGLYLSAFYLDIAAVSGASLSTYSSKGLNFAVSTGLYF